MTARSRTVDRCKQGRSTLANDNVLIIWVIRVVFGLGPEADRRDNMLAYLRREGVKH
jgi:hypothetical protein